jgi:hypothetical protein
MKQENGNKVYVIHIGRFVFFILSLIFNIVILGTVFWRLNNVEYKNQITDFKVENIYSDIKIFNEGGEEVIELYLIEQHYYVLLKRK